MVATMKQIDNLRRKIRRARKKETLERYQKQLDKIIIDLDASIAAHTAELESLQPRGYFRHSYSYDQFDERLRTGPIRRRGHSKYLSG